MSSFYEVLLDAQQAQIERLTKDLEMDDITSFMYHVLYDDYKENPTIATLKSGGASAARLMLAMLMLERSKLLVERNVANERATQVEAQLDHYRPLDRILKENEMYSRNVHEIGRKNVDLQERIRQLEVQLQGQSLLVSKHIREEFDARRARAHDQINQAHLEMLAKLVDLKVDQAPELRDACVSYLEVMRLIIETT